MGLILESKEHFLTRGKNLIKVEHSRKSSSICPECSGNESKKREKKIGNTECGHSQSQEGTCKSVLVEFDDLQNVGVEKEG